MTARRIIRDLDGTPRYVDDEGMTVTGRYVEIEPAKGDKPAKREWREIRVRWVRMGDMANDPLPRHPD